MGNTSLRRLLSKETKWTDKDTQRHKHNFNIETCACVKCGNTVSYYHVMKCEYCNSFHSIPEEGNITGFRVTSISGLPLIKLYKSHKTIGFNGAVLDSKVM